MTTARVGVAEAGMIVAPDMLENLSPLIVDRGVSGRAPADLRRISGGASPVPPGLPRGHGLDLVYVLLTAGVQG
ncbi:hypothetical protein GCM10027590_04490 [Nocardiopsis nanhaiensis]